MPARGRRAPASCSIAWARHYCRSVHAACVNACPDDVRRIRLARPDTGVIERGARRSGEWEGHTAQRPQADREGRTMWRPSDDAVASQGAPHDWETTADRGVPTPGGGSDLYC